MLVSVLDSFRSFCFAVAAENKPNRELSAVYYEEMINNVMVVCVCVRSKLENIAIGIVAQIWCGARCVDLDSNKNHFIALFKHRMATLILKLFSPLLFCCWFGLPFTENVICLMELHADFQFSLLLTGSSIKSIYARTTTNHLKLL